MKITRFILNILWIAIVSGFFSIVGLTLAFSAAVTLDTVFSSDKIITLNMLLLLPFTWAVTILSLLPFTLIVGLPIAIPAAMIFGGFMLGLQQRFRIFRNQAICIGVGMIIGAFLGSIFPLGDPGNWGWVISFASGGAFGARTFFKMSNRYFYQPSFKINSPA